MANALQRNVFRRKLAYAGIILALFTVTIFWRGKLPVPFSGALPVADRLSAGSIEARSKALDLRELDQGDPEILGTTLRLTLFGTRGVAVSVLWAGAIQKQKRNEFGEFQVLVKAVTKLQPNFIIPWLYQSWNMAYNVSVEHDKLGDMYYYIARGIQLLADGDRVNTKVYRDPADGQDHDIGSPDIRRSIGFYYQNKFSVSDKVSTLRSLMQVSVIKPADRRRAMLEPAGQGVDPVAFARFVKANPQLVRRLKAKLNCNQPEEVVQFLADNDKIPTLFKNDNELAAADEQFPVLPRRFPEGPDEYYPGRPADDTFDAFHASRAWFSYAQPIVPPAKTDARGEPLPWKSPEPGEYDTRRYRMPRSPALVIYKTEPCRSQSYLAERLATEGWFDKETVWDPAGAGATGLWGSGGLSTPATAQAEWVRAARMWAEYGQQNGITLSDDRRAQLEDRAGRRGRTPGAAPPGDADRAEAAEALRYLDQNRSLINFGYFLATAKAEGEAVTVQARKALYAADAAKATGDNVRAADEYRAALAKWRQVLARFPEYHRPPGGASQTNEENTYEYEMSYVGLLKEDGRVQARVQATADASAAVLGPLGQSVKADLVQAVAEDEAGLMVAAEAVVSDDPLVRPPPGDPRDAARQEVDKAMAGKPAADRTPAARRDEARRVIAAKYPWMKTLKAPPPPTGEPPADLYWVTPDIREIVRQRAGLVRKAPPAAPEVAPDGPGADGPR